MKPVYIYKDHWIELNLQTASDGTWLCSTKVDGVAFIDDNGAVRTERGTTEMEAHEKALTAAQASINLLARVEATNTL